MASVWLGSTEGGMSHVGTALEALGKLRENVMGKGKAWLGEGGSEVHGTRGAWTRLVGEEVGRVAATFWASKNVAVLGDGGGYVTFDPCSECGSNVMYYTTSILLVLLCK
ncbi:hypothetical protein PIB30_105587 [Stylosanthes scabra]|uniref:Uncharacterized protein n=1 Tax=Stylosanthes scabra TaxID=79078 RepID=A0ABU6TY60_9FABA|nr:hypothetical protein [Stylosanthes scabra]